MPGESGELGRIAAGSRAVWITSAARRVVYRIDPSTDRVIAAIHLDGPSTAVAVGGGRVWVTIALPGPGRLIAIDPRTNRVIVRPIIVGPRPGQVVYGRHAVWVQNTSPASVMRIDPASARVKTVIALGDREVWVLSYPRSRPPAHFEPIRHTASVWEIDPRTDRIIGKPIRLGALQPIAISELPPTGALLFLLGQPPGPSGQPGRHPLGERPPRFHLEDLAAQRRECFRTSRMVDFQTAGRELYLLAYFGPRASRHTYTLADQTLNSLVLHAPKSPAVARSGAFEPRLSPTEERYVSAAWNTTVARDPGCRGFAGPELTRGSPGRDLASRFAILRRPPVAADGLRALLHISGRAWTAGTDLYLNQIRRARSALGATFYVIPAGNVTGQRGVPARCGAEQIATLKHRLSRLAPRRRTRILAAQARYLQYLRYLALHPEGICATFVLTRAGYLHAGDNFGCATIADFGRWGVLADTQAYLGGRVAAFWTVVPDGVATVTLTFTAPNGRRLMASTVRAVNNVVVAKEPYKAPNQSGFPSTIVLRAADGRTIKKIDVTPNMPTLCGYGC
jgi:hypothetical protein